LQSEKASELLEGLNEILILGRLDPAGVQVFNSLECGAWSPLFVARFTHPHLEER
jgi:hypothetical protein